MRKRDKSLGMFELKILLVALTIDSGISAYKILSGLVDETGTSQSHGAVYTAIKRLVAKDYLARAAADAAGPHKAILYEVTASGKRAVKECLELLNRMSATLNI